MAQHRPQALARLVVVGGFVVTGSTATVEFTCPGRLMPQPADAPGEGYVACYRAGHHCPPKVGYRTETEEFVTCTYRCPCCGDFGGSWGMPKGWLTNEEVSR
jgi:hypothetical protein